MKIIGGLSPQASPGQLQLQLRKWVERVGPRLLKKVTFMAKALEPALRIAITLRYLATRHSYFSLSYNFRVAL